jgi:high-affinity nickel permease
MMDPVSQTVTILGFGLLLGVEHALDADHVVAVSTITSENKSLKASSKVGALWGMGHTLTLLLVGILVLSFKLSIPQKLALGMEFLVGVVLAVLGGSVLYKVLKQKLHLHAHRHDNLLHEHPHPQTEEDHQHHHRSLIVGMIHGLAGSSALMLLVLSTIPSFGLGILYILVFGVGSIAGMFVISTLIGLPFVLTNRFILVNRWIRMIAGIVSILLGISIMVQTGAQVLSLT